MKQCAKHGSILASTLMFFVAGCSMAPDYQVPATPIPSEFKEKGIWSSATPSDALPKGNWWQIYDDQTLNSLETQLDKSNTNLAAALAKYDEAEAYVAEAEAPLFPTLGAAYNPTQNKQSANRPLRSANQPNYYAADTTDATLNYELDLWGSVRNAVAAGKARAEAESADDAAIKLSLESELAIDYVKLRDADEQDQLLKDTVTAYSKAYALTTRRHQGGVASGLDVGRAQTQLEDARAQASEVEASRALYEHAIATLAGQPASSFSISSTSNPITLPNIPTGVPSTLLERRPDIAAAERKVAAANAEIGVARAAFFPTITLAGIAGFQNTGEPGLVTAPNLFWTVGPNAALTIFQGGERTAQLDVAKAKYQEAADLYRGDVLGAFQDVEDNLATLNHLASASVDQATAVDAASRTESLSMDRYQLGAVNYLDVVTAQAAALTAKQKALDIETRRLEASVRLIKAIGGGWTANSVLAESDSGQNVGSSAAGQTPPQQ